MAKETATHMLERYQVEVMAGLSIDAAWHLEAEDCAEATFDARVCERLAGSAPTDFLAGLWWGRALVLLEVQRLVR